MLQGIAFRLGFLALLGLGACNNYQLADSFDPAHQPAQPTPPSLPLLLSPIDYYVSVVADAEPTSNGSPASVCSHSYALPYVATQNQAVSLSALLDGQTPIPLYTVNSDTSTNTCDIVYSERYLLPHVRFSSGSLYTIGAKYLYQTTGKESISTYLTEGQGLAALLSPSSAPALATAAAIESSPAAQQITNLVNTNLLGSETSVTKKLVDIDYTNPLKPASQAVQLQINQVPLDSGRSPQMNQATVLGTVTVTTRQNLTVLGTDPPVGGPAGTYPDYSHVTLNTSVVIVPNPTAMQMYTLLNTQANLGDVDDVVSLASTATTSSVRTACGKLRSAMQTLTLNYPDTTAYLWIAYSASPYAVANENMNKLTSACLTTGEKTLVKALKLDTLLGQS
jgi:hypothetical protein